MKPTRFTRQFVLISVVMIFINNHSPAQNIDVEIPHPIYKFLDYLEASGLTCSVITATKPMSRQEIYQVLESVISLKSSTINPIIFQTARYYLAMFSDFSQPAKSDRKMLLDLQKITNGRLFSKVPFYKNSRFLFAHRKKNWSIIANPLIALSHGTVVLDSIGQVGLTKRSSGLQIAGKLGAHVAFYSDARDTRESGNRYFPEGHRLVWPGYGYAEGRGDYLYHDEALAYINLKFNKFVVQIGKNSNRWGPAGSGDLILNNTAASYNQIRLTVNAPKARLIYFHAGLQAHPGIVKESYFSNSVERQILAEKYIAGHRLELFPFPRLMLALNETVVYGERGLQLAYLMPLMFFRSAEHYYGDRDNVALGGDFKLFVAKNLLFYGEMLFDDFSWSRLGTDWYGNKLAWLAGARWANSILAIPVMLRGEYVRIRPYVYSHTFPVNAYTHYGTGLGHPLQPNSDALYFNARFYPYWNASFTIQYFQSRHGCNLENENVGGSIVRAFDVHDSQNIEFLTGRLDLRRALKISATFALFYNFNLCADITWQTHNNKNDKRQTFFTSTLGMRLNFYDKKSQF